MANEQFERLPSLSCHAGEDRRPAEADVAHEAVARAGRHRRVRHQRPQRGQLRAGVRGAARRGLGEAQTPEEAQEQGPRETAQEVARIEPRSAASAAAHEKITLDPRQRDTHHRSNAFLTAIIPPAPPPPPIPSTCSLPLPTVMTRV